MTPGKRVYVRPAEGLPRKEAVRQMARALLEALLEQAQAAGDEKAAAHLRAELAEGSQKDQAI